MKFPPHLPCLLNLSLVSFAFLLSVFSCIVCSIFSPTILIVSLLILSSVVICNFTNIKQMLGESTLPHEVLSSDGMKHPLQIKVAMKILPENSAILLQKEYQQDTIMDQMPNCITTSPDLSPGCKSIDFSPTREDFNVNWSYPYNMGNFPA